MLRGYIRLTKTGLSLEQQQELLRGAGITDFSETGPVYVDRIPKGKRIKEQSPQRKLAIRSLEKSDVLVVANAGCLGSSAADILAAMEEVGKKSALICDAEADELIEFHPALVKSIAFVKRAETAQKQGYAANMRIHREASGKPLGAPPVAKDKLDVARKLWLDPKKTSADVARETGISVATLWRRLGRRDPLSK